MELDGKIPVKTLRLTRAGMGAFPDSKETMDGMFRG
jgi:hypothetical protein